MNAQDKNVAWFLPRPKPDKYKGGMPLHAEEWLLNLASEILWDDKDEWRLRIDNILNLFCGMNKHGFRIDIKPEVKPDYVKDAHDFVDGLNGWHGPFDIILADPPYSTEEARDIYGTPKLNYKKWTKEADRVLNPGGLLIVYHKYVVPNPDPKKYEVVKRVFIGSRTWHLPRVAIFFRKKV